MDGAADFALLAAAVNLARLAALGVTSNGPGLGGGPHMSGPGPAPRAVRPGATPGQSATTGGICAAAMTPREFQAPHRAQDVSHLISHP